MEVTNYVMRPYLDSLKANRTRVTIITKNGYQMGGRIENTDECSILFNVEGINRLVMLSAVSTIIPKE